MDIHVCLFDSNCRRFGAPWRIQLTVRNWVVSVAFRPGDKFGYIDAGGRITGRWLDIRKIE